MQNSLCTSHSQARLGGMRDDLHKKRLQSVIEEASKGRLAKLSAFQEAMWHPGRPHLLKKSCFLSCSYWWLWEQKAKAGGNAGVSRWSWSRKGCILNPWREGPTAERENSARSLSCNPSPLQSGISTKRLRSYTGSWENKGAVTSAATAQSQQPSIVWQMQIVLDFKKENCLEKGFVQKCARSSHNSY